MFSAFVEGVDDCDDLLWVLVKHAGERWPTRVEVSSSVRIRSASVYRTFQYVQ